MMDKLMTLTTVMVSHMYPNLQAHEVVYIKYLQVSFVNYTLIVFFLSMEKMIRKLGVLEGQYKENRGQEINK